jgi:hypothetical protein
MSRSEWPGVGVALADALSCPGGELVGLIGEPVGVAGVLAGTILTDRDEALRILLLGLVDEDLEDVGGGEELREHETLGGLMGTDLIDRCASWHAERDDDERVLGLDEALAGDSEVLESRDRPASHCEALAISGAALELGDSHRAHVDAGKGRVDDSDRVHGARLAFSKALRRPCEGPAKALRSLGEVFEKAWKRRLRDPRFALGRGDISRRQMNTSWMICDRPGEQAIAFRIALRRAR